MPLVIQIRAATATGRDVKTKNGMRRFYEQVGFIEVNDEVRKIRVPIDVEGGQQAYAVGKYTLAASSFTVGKFHDLEINSYEFGLEPVGPVAASAQSKVV